MPKAAGEFSCIRSRLTKFQVGKQPEIDLACLLNAYIDAERGLPKACLCSSFDPMPQETEILEEKEHDKRTCTHAKKQSTGSDRITTVFFLLCLIVFPLIFF